MSEEFRGDKKENMINFMKKSSKISQENKPKTYKEKLDYKKREEENQEKEEVDEAKKTSNAKASNYNKSMMTNRLITQNIAKNVLLISLLVGFALFFMYFTPIFFKFIHNWLGNSIISH